MRQHEGQARCTAVQRAPAHRGAGAARWRSAGGARQDWCAVPAITTRSSNDRDALPYGRRTSCTARSGRRCGATGSLQWSPAAHRWRPADGPVRWRRPRGSRRGSSSGRPSSRITARPWAAKASFSSITSICASDSPVSASTLREAGTGADAHDARRHARSGHAHHAGTRRQALAGQRPVPTPAAGAQAPSLTPEALPAVTLPSGRHHTLQLRQCVEAGLPRMLVLRHHERVALLLGHGHRRDLDVEPASLLCRHRPSSGWQEPCGPGQGARCLNWCATFSGRFGHRIDAVLFLHQLVDEAPADRGVMDRIAAAEGRFGLGHHERRAAHALNTAQPPSGRPLRP